MVWGPGVEPRESRYGRSFWRDGKEEWRVSLGGLAPKGKLLVCKCLAWACGGLPGVVVAIGESGGYVEPGWGEAGGLWKVNPLAAV